VAAARARHEEAKAGMGISAAEMEQAQLDYKRNKPLAANDAISRKTWDETRTASQMAAEKLRLAQARVSESAANLADAITKRADVTVLQKQLEELGHDIEQTRRQIAQKEVDLDDRTLRSPINGVVDQKFVEPGEYVIPGQRLLLLHDPQSVWIEVALKETKLTDVRVGQPVDISIDAYPGRRFTGRVERVGNAATNQFALLPNPNPSGNFTKIAQRVPVRVKVEQPEGNPLRPGMMVEVDIDVSLH
jgi:membrane fusion protein (multidrug efflux system)